jgi:hypothetical protein
MTKKDPTVVKKVSVSLHFGLGFAEWEVDPTKHNAAWSLYIELVTRTAVQLEVDQESLREALNSLCSLFLSKWHPFLQDWEAKRVSDLSPKEYGGNWVDESQLRNELLALRMDSEKYLNALSEIVEVRATHA